MFWDVVLWILLGSSAISLLLAIRLLIYYIESRYQSMSDFKHFLLSWALVLLSVSCMILCRIAIEMF